jgi:hypothetical protein
MVRVTGWYKRKTQLIMIGLALVICIGMNVDTFAIANSLYRDSALRASVVATAQESAKKGLTTNLDPQKGFEETVTQVRNLNLPIGWVLESQVPNDPRLFKGRDWFKGWDGLLKLLGLLFSIMAVSLGAPFWFDLLNKLVNLRGTGNAPKPAAGKP